MRLNPKDAIRNELQLRGKRKRRMYLFYCLDCKKELWYRRSDVLKRYGRCHTCAARITIISTQKLYVKRPFEAIYNRMAKSAVDRSLSLTITYDDFLAYTNICNCHYCGSPIKWSKDTKAGNSKAANLDRKNNELGYTAENVVVACAICNRIKNKYLNYDDMMLLSPILRRIIPGKHL